MPRADEPQPTSNPASSRAQDAAAAEAAMKAAKDLIVAQHALEVARAQLPFAAMEGVRAAMAKSPLPTGKEGTVSVASGAPGTGLLRSKRPLFDLLAEVAADLITHCEGGAVLVSKEQLEQAESATFTLKWLDLHRERLAEALNLARAGLDRMTRTDEASRGPEVATPRAVAAVLPVGIAGAHALGLTLDTINSLTKLFRTDRRVDVYGDTEAENLLVHLLEAKGLESGIDQFVADPVPMGDGLIPVAESLLETLEGFDTAVREAEGLLGGIRKAAAEEHLDDPTWPARRLSDEDVARFEQTIAAARSLLEALDPARKPDVVSTLVRGKALADRIKGNKHLILNVKAQTIQVTETSWFRSARILATGEVQVAYRVLDPNGTPIRSGVILKASQTLDARIDWLGPVNWPPLIAPRAGGARGRDRPATSRDRHPPVGPPGLQALFLRKAGRWNATGFLASVARVQSRRLRRQVHRSLSWQSG